ncbi:MAG: hypothetical protein H6573_32365 [Lewinellaceae bacterium]|nr:hypothetical protein [Phaeodactylibacter sp.]MCB9352154.1 hypothetical protein [Lewinellaceae bacterium]
MQQTTTKNTPDWVVHRVLGFLNSAKNAREITEGVQDDPRNGKGPAIGMTVARRIMEARGRSRFRRFRDIQELAEVQGFGQDKMDDLVTVTTTAARKPPTPSLCGGTVSMPTTGSVGSVFRKKPKATSATTGSSPGKWRFGSSKASATAVSCAA